MSAIKVNFEIGHEAFLKPRRTIEGFTHDWKVFVRGQEGADISRIVDKVVFHLHETFPNPERVVEDPPFSIEESGWAGFDIPIELYLRNEDEPKKIRFIYNLSLDQSGYLKDRYIFQNPNEEFKKKIIGYGGIPVNQIFNAKPDQEYGSKDSFTEEKEQLVNKPNLSSKSVNKHKCKNNDYKDELRHKSNIFEDLFEVPLQKPSKILPEPKKNVKNCIFTKPDNNDTNRSNSEKKSKHEHRKFKLDKANIKEKEKKDKNLPEKIKKKTHQETGTENSINKCSRKGSQSKTDNVANKRCISPSKKMSSPRSSSISSVKDKYKPQEPREPKKLKVDDKRPEMKVEEKNKDKKRNEKDKEREDKEEHKKEVHKPKESPKEFSNIDAVDICTGHLDSENFLGNSENKSKHEHNDSKLDKENIKGKEEKEKNQSSQKNKQSRDRPQSPTENAANKHYISPSSKMTLLHSNSISNMFDSNMKVMMSAIKVHFEIGHVASTRMRCKQSPEGFTHDWKVFVRGKEGADISNFVDKVVFHLHETYHEPRRVVEEPPFFIKESGYAGFNIPIEIYLKNKEEPKKIKLTYDLSLQISGSSKHEYIFQNLNEEFRKKLLKGGGIPTNSDQENKSRDSFTEEKQQVVNEPKLSSEGIKTHKRKNNDYKDELPDKSKIFEHLFGVPLKKPSKISPESKKNDKHGITTKPDKKDTTNSEKKSKHDHNKPKLDKENIKEKEGKEKNLLEKIKVHQETGKENFINKCSRDWLQSQTDIVANKRCISPSRKMSPPPSSSISSLKDKYKPQEPREPKKLKVDDKRPEMKVCEKNKDKKRNEKDKDRKVKKEHKKEVHKPKESPKEFSNTDAVDICTGHLDSENFVVPDTNMKIVQSPELKGDLSSEPEIEMDPETEMIPKPNPQLQPQLVLEIPPTQTEKELKTRKNKSPTREEKRRKRKFIVTEDDATETKRMKTTDTSYNNETEREDSSLIIAETKVQNNGVASSLEEDEDRDVRLRLLQRIILASVEEQGEDINRVMNFIAETGPYDIEEKYAVFDLALLDRSKVQQLIQLVCS